MVRLADLVLPRHGGEASAVGVQIRDLSKAFGALQVLRGVTVEVRPGERMTIIGGSGAGKTVLLKHIAGLLTADRGDVLLDGVSANWVARRQEPTAPRVGYVFQGSALFNSLTVSENVALALKENNLYPPDEIARIVAETLDLVGLKDKATVRPGELSGGMKKRCAVARALALKPHLILYDEPTSELDPIMAETITQVIVDLNERLKITSLVVTHDLDVALVVSHRVAMLHDGRILFVGTPEEIKASRHPVVLQFLTTKSKGF